MKRIPPSSLIAMVAASLLGCTDIASDSPDGPPEESLTELSMQSEALTRADVAFVAPEFVRELESLTPRFRFHASKLIASNFSSWPAGFTSGEIPGDPAGDALYFSTPYRSSTENAGIARGPEELGILAGCTAAGGYCSSAASLASWSGLVPAAAAGDSWIYKFAGVNQTLSDEFQVSLGAGHFSSKVLLRFLPGGTVYAENEVGAAVNLGTIPPPYSYNIQATISPVTGEAKFSTSFGPARTLGGAPFADYERSYATLSFWIQETSPSPTYVRLRSFSVDTFGAFAY